MGTSRIREFIDNRRITASVGEFIPLDELYREWDVTLHCEDRSMPFKVTCPVVTEGCPDVFYSLFAVAFQAIAVGHKDTALRLLTLLGTEEAYIELKSMMQPQKIGPSR